MIIDGIELGKEAYVIAEIGSNHGGNLERCKEMFKVAKECGAQAVKLQKRDNKTLFTPKLYNQPYINENSYGDTYGAHREALEFDFEQYKELKAYAKELNITFFATAFDFPSVDFLEKLGVPCYKIASGDLLNTPLQRYIAQTKKPVFLSTGGGTFDDISRAYDTIYPINKDLVLMQCTASYPCSPENMYLGVLTQFSHRYFNVLYGLSDHYAGKLMSPIAYVLGARVFEKHFTLSHTWKGTDQAFSLEPEALGKLVRDLKHVQLAMKEGKFLLDCEKKPLYKMGKKLVFARDM
ncbi:MAG: N-acetylneuraminate synthase family protein, partial [Candidatus Omnitrophica bacterium]|nr:N-acetylneuraminate synthase family protein [Candidatus Omnitrophota bacterium]